MPPFHLKHFSLQNEKSAMKISTDSLLLGSVATIPADCERIIDVGTGTGIIAMMAAQRCPAATVVGIEIDPASAKEAASNFAEGPWSGRMSVLQGDWRELAPTVLERSGGATCGGLNYVSKTQLIISNPPYYEEDTRSPYVSKAAAKSTQAAGLSYRDIFDAVAVSQSPAAEANTQISLILPYGLKDKVFFYARRSGFFPFRLVAIRTLEGKAPSRLVAEFCTDRTAQLAQETLTLFVRGSEKTPEYQAYLSEFQGIKQ